MRFTFYLQRGIFLLGLVLAGPLAKAQSGFFEPLSSAQARTATPDAGKLERSALYRLKTADLRTYLAKAPLEFRTSTAPLRVAIPLPNGTVETFGILESPILSPALAVVHRGIKTYTGRGLANPTYTIRLSLTSSGFDAIILGVENDAVYYTKTSDSPGSEVYMTYFAREAKRASAEAQPFGLRAKCGTESALIDVKKASNGKARLANNTGTMLRTFRLAVAATGEFTQRKGGGNVNNAFNAVVGYVNRMNAVYRVELSVAFQLVSGTNLVYPNPATDPYDNSKQSQMLGENQTNMVNVLGVNGFDVGHVFGFSGDSGAGIARGRSACNDNAKGQGVSGVGDGSFAAVFDDQLISHEVGHQFGMEHTYNSSKIGACTTREANYSVEPGSGATIMSYGFTCSDRRGNNEDYESTYLPFLNFHTVSYQQAVEFMATVSCGPSTATNNAVPAIGQFPTNTTIPRSTPFELTGTATDANAGDVLSYSWEGTNIGNADDTTISTLTNTAKPPFFRSYPPVPTGTRVFPRLEAILNGSNYATGDKLPSVGIATTHRLTVRDGVGGVNYQTVTVTVDGNAGPFLVTSNLNGSYTGGTQQTINWDVANTTAAPVNCASVNIQLSTDGGRTFPITLLANTPNDGTEPVTFPNITNNQCRIRVMAANNIFFDISNSNFTVLDPNNQPPVAVAIPNQTGTLDAAFAFTPPAFTDPENQQLTYRTLGLPTSLSMNPDTRVISGTPAAVGPFSVTIVATDPGNLTASTTFILTINPGPIVPLVVSLTASATTFLTTGNTSVTALVSGGRPPYSYNYGANGSLAAVASSGNRVTFSDVTAGVQTFTILVTDTTLPVNQTTAATISVTVLVPGGAPVVGVEATDATASERRTASKVSQGARVAAGASDVDTGIIQFQRNSSVGRLVVDYRIDGSAIPGVDYVELPGSMTFLDGQRTVDVEIIPIVDDNSSEQDETIIISLIDEDGYDLDPSEASATVTILGDAPPTPPGPASSLTITSFTCNINPSPALSRVDFVVSRGDGSIAPAVAPLLIVGVTGNGSLGTRYSFPFDQNVNTLAVQDAATRSTYFVWNIRAACGTTPPPSPTVVVPPTPVSSLTITSFTCAINASPALSRVDFVVSRADGSIAPAVAPLLIVGVTGNGSLGTRYSFPFDQNVSTVTVQDAATRSAYFTWNIRQACAAPAMARLAEPTASWQLLVQGNPTTGLVNILVKGAQGRSLELSLQDVSGRKLMGRNLQPQADTHRETFDVSALSGGLFILRATDGQHSQTVKIVKQ